MILFKVTAQYLPDRLRDGLYTRTGIVTAQDAAEAARSAITNGLLPLCVDNDVPDRCLGSSRHAQRDTFWHPCFGEITISPSAPFIFGGWLVYAFVEKLRFPLAVHVKEVGRGVYDCAKES